MKQSTVLKMNLGGDEMGKQDDVMKNGKRGEKGISQAFHFELRGIRWPVSRIIEEFHLLSMDWHLSHVKCAPTCAFCISVQTF